MTRVKVKRADLLSRKYDQSPIIQDMSGRMKALFGDDFLDRMVDCGRQLNPIVYGSPDAYVVAETARVDAGSLQRSVLHELRRGDMMRDQMLNPRTSDHMDALLSSMPVPVSQLLSSYVDEYGGKGDARPIGRVSDALDTACVLTFWTGALDVALMDFHPKNPLESALASEVPGLVEKSGKVIIVAGPTAVGKDAIVDMFLKRKLLEQFLPADANTDMPLQDLMEQVAAAPPLDAADAADCRKVLDDLENLLGYPNEGRERPDIERDELFEMAKRRLGVHRLTKLTGRARRPDEVDGVHYHYFDGGDMQLDVSREPMLDPNGGIIKDGSRPTEDTLIGFRQDGRHPLAYSYRYNGHYYGFPTHTVPSGEYHKPWDIAGLKEILDDPAVNMLILGSGTTPEVLYMKSLLPRATALYVLPHQPHRSISVIEEESHNRWWGRALRELQHNIESGGASWPRDKSGFAKAIEDKSKERFCEVTPQITLAMLCSREIPGLHLLPNIHGIPNLMKASEDLNTILRKSGQFPGMFQR
ncbi:MAG: hypothetical protein ABH834_07115 [Candidatus Altiarchaeota archaeon]